MGIGNILCIDFEWSLNELKQQVLNDARSHRRLRWTIKFESATNIWHNEGSLNIFNTSYLHGPPIAIPRELHLDAHQLQKANWQT